MPPPGPPLPQLPWLVLSFQLASVALALWGVVRLAGLRALSDHPRLRRLSWFFVLFALSLAAQCLVTLMFANLGGAGPGGPGPGLGPADSAGPRAGLVPTDGGTTLDVMQAGRPHGNGTRAPFQGLHGAAGGPVFWLDAVRHGLMAAALVVAVWAYGASPFGQRGRGRDPAGPQGGAGGMAAMMLFGSLGLAGFVEAGLALYLSIVTMVNNRRRATRRSLAVALGFFLFFLGHAAYWVYEPLDGPRPFWAEGLTLLGTILLVLAIPRVRPAPGPSPLPPPGPPTPPARGA